MMIITIKNANQCEVDGPLKVVHKLYNEFKIKHPNAWHIQMYQRGNNKWDGYIKYINDYGIFRIGLLPKVYETLISWGEEVKIIDRRPKLSIEPNIPKSLGSIDLYPRQIEALNNLLIQFPIFEKMSIKSISPDDLFVFILSVISSLIY